MTPQADKVLGEFFSSLVESAGKKRSTGATWEALFDSVTAWLEHEGVLTITLGREPTLAELAGAARSMLAGVSAADVARWRKIAGKAAAAHTVLSQLDLDAPIPDEAVFRPPWSVTA